MAQPRKVLAHFLTSSMAGKDEKLEKKQENSVKYNLPEIGVA